MATVITDDDSDCAAAMVITNEARNCDRRHDSCRWQETNFLHGSKVASHAAKNVNENGVAFREIFRDSGTER